MKNKSSYESTYSKIILWIIVLLAYCYFIRKLWNIYQMNNYEDICPLCGESFLPIWLYYKIVTLCY